MIFIDEMEDFYSSGQHKKSNNLHSSSAYTHEQKENIA